MGLKEKEKIEQSSINYKARLEKKLYLAQESPEPVFDVSDCNLKALPSNIFALCKALRKEALYLNNNNLVSLASGGSLMDLKYIKLLNISANKLTKLPSNLQALESLEVFDVSMNQLTELPESLGALTKLCLFNVSHNSLVSLPDTIGLCKSLESLDLTWNEGLKRLQPAMCKLTSLRQLNIDSTITYPPKDICNQGVKEILKFLAKDYKEEAAAATTSGDPSKKAPHDDYQFHIEQHQKQQHEKQQERIRVERDIMDQKQKEIELQQRGRDEKKRLIESVKDQQDAQDADIMKLQEKKKAEHAQLLKTCQEEEKRAHEVVAKMLRQKKNLQLQFTKEWENDRKAEEELLYRSVAETKHLEKKKILASMEEVMREEILKMQKLTSDSRYQAVSTLASGISQQNKTITTLLSKKNEDRKNLIESLRQDEELQKSAVASLLEKSDVASWELAEQITIIEDELAELTLIEISKRKLESDARVADLNKNRTALTEMLANLLERQTQRRFQLIESIRRMETVKETAKESELFWMHQYDKLMSSKGLEMVQFLESLDYTLVTQFYIHGVFHYLPLLRDVISSEEKISDLREPTLIELGIKNAEDAAKILRAVKAFIEVRDNLRGFSTVEEPANVTTKMPKSAKSVQNRPTITSMSTSLHPTSSLRNRIASRTSYLATDCVICMEAKPAALFFPCGHICCCFNCLGAVTTCPLCRSPIESVHKRAEQSLMEASP